MSTGYSSEPPAHFVESLSDELVRELSTNRTSLNVLRAGRTALKTASELGDRSQDAVRRACRVGCSACCHLAVAILPLEALVLADGLRVLFASDQLDNLISRIARVAEQISHLTIEQRARAKVACALLGADGACMIHPFRPIGCRGWTSFDRAACDDALRAERPGHVGPQDHWNYTVASCTTEAVQRACRELGLEAGHKEFHAALRIALQTEHAADRFMAGERLFESCPEVTSELLRG